MRIAKSRESLEGARFGRLGLPLWAVFESELHRGRGFFAIRQDRKRGSPIRRSATFVGASFAPNHCSVANQELVSQVARHRLALLTVRDLGGIPIRHGSRGQCIKRV